MRTIIKSLEYEEFYSSLPPKVKDKIKYVLYALVTQSVVNAKFVKKLIGTDFYELRISVDNEYRVIMVSINTDNIIEATSILLLNGFMKKSTKDYNKQIEIANKIVGRY